MVLVQLGRVLLWFGVRELDFRLCTFYHVLVENGLLIHADSDHDRYRSQLVASYHHDIRFTNHLLDCHVLQRPLRNRLSYWLSSVLPEAQPLILANE